jgi:outer membrane protein TolC
MKIFFLCLFSSHVCWASSAFESALSQLLSKDEILVAQSTDTEASTVTLRKTEWGLLAPDLNLLGTYGQTGESMSKLSDFKQYGVSSSMSLFRFGADYYRIQSASQNEAKSKLNYQNAFLDREQFYVQALGESLSQSKQLQILRESVTQRKNYFRIAQLRYQQGLLSKQEVDKIMIDLSNAEARLADTEVSFEISKNQLRTALSEEQLKMDWPWKDQASPRRILALSHRDFTRPPKLQAAELEKQSFDDLRKSARSALLPSLDLDLSYGKLFAASSSGVEEYKGFLTLKIPLFSRMTDYYNLSLANLAVRKSEVQMSQVQRELISSVETAQRELKLVAESALSRENTTRISKGLLDDNIKRFQAGRTSVNELLQDQERLNQAELLANEGWKQFHAALTRICHLANLRMSQCLGE